ncbi:uncharacterized protein C8Q71DRAFT_356939 [Rhodofomes roseus]|uniref:DUF6589 domain-containing protein n=1 Tax=Rhodofomes roseus TaxID=34475 RepID=A0ABQ8KT95_9APHY|nr:uncharacterized protein C8Q71DRAFT_356939 [Rhodofomes roseus]KAH9842004.1 hypothetical protein C8Q71DRAFT_356939 [Rhodofomes roseus]
MGRKPPSNLSKVDYNEGMETLFTVLDARILDCFRLHWDTPDLFTYFAKRAEEKTLPSLGELEDVALSLYRAYSTSRGYERAVYAQSDCDCKTMLPSNLNPTPDGPVDKPTPWEKTVPIRNSLDASHRSHILALLRRVAASGSVRGRRGERAVRALRVSG